MIDSDGGVVSIRTAVTWCVASRLPAASSPQYSSVWLPSGMEMDAPPGLPLVAAACSAAPSIRKSAAWGPAPDGSPVTVRITGPRHAGIEAVDVGGALSNGSLVTNPSPCGQKAGSPQAGCMG